MRRLALVLLLPVLVGCEALQQAAGAIQVAEQAKMPTVAYKDATLVQAPSKGQMAAYYCPQMVTLPFAGSVCAGFFGSPLAPQQMRVSFDLRFTVANPNHFPIPVAELLTAAVVFPDKALTGLGAACVAFCGADQPGCTGQPGPGSCVSHRGDIKSLKDFENASANLLVAAGVEAALGGQPTFQMPQVVQDGEVVVTARFTFGPEALLQVLKQIASQAVDQLAAGKSIDFTIPYRLEGTTWLDVGSLGRVELGWGPAAGTWQIPSQALVP
jgi:hypothetical protein